MRKTYIVLGLVIVILAAAAAGAILLFKAVASRHESRVIAEGIERIARLVTVEYHMSTNVLKTKDRKWTERMGPAWFASASGTVKGSVDLRSAKVDVSRDPADKYVRIVFAPEAVKVSYPEIRPGDVVCRTIRDSSGRITDSDRDEARDEALKSMREVAVRHGIREKTIERAEVLLREFLSPLGYRVEITFQGGSVSALNPDKLWHGDLSTTGSINSTERGE